MVISARDVSLNPSHLLDGFEEMGLDSDRRWWILHTKARQEKAVARDIARFDVPFFLPLIKNHASGNRSRRVSCVPMFAGYVFVYGSSSEREICLKTNRLANILPVHDGVRLRHELRQVSQLVDSDFQLRMEPRIEPGQRVRVVAGPLIDLEGIVVQRHGRSRLIVAVEMLRQGVSVNLEEWAIELVN